MTRKEVLEFISSIDGWLSPHEGYFLYEIAKKTKGNVVEIGSWKGKSTICLGSGLGKKGKVYAIDPHKGEYSGKNGIGKEAPTFKVFQENLKKAGIANVVKPIVATSQEAAGKWKGKISFLFIDGLHDFLHTYQDFSLWSPFLKDGGIIAFHDAFCGHDGPEKVILKKILFRNQWSNIGVIGSIVYAQKRKARTFWEKADLFRNRALIPLAMYLNQSSFPAGIKFFLIHRIIKLLLLNEFTLQLLGEKI